MERYNRTRTVKNNQLETVWRENVSIGVQYAGIHQETLDMFAEFQEK